MIVLGLDSATSATVAGLLLGDGRVSQAHEDAVPGERPAHATRLLALAAGLLQGAGLSWAGVQRIAVGTGPGGFTGLRIGVACARGLAQSLEVQVTGVSTLRALAEGAALAQAQVGGRLRPVLAVLDARRGEVYCGGWVQARELVGTRAVAPEQLGEVLRSVVAPEQLGEVLRSVVAPEQLSGVLRSADTPAWLAVGDGAIRFRAHLDRAGVEVPDDASPLHQVSGAVLCRLAAAGPGAAPEAVLPDYRRSPDARVPRQMSRS